MQKPDEDKLVKACLKGSRKAHSKLYALYKDQMFGICLRYAASEAEASDMLQEGFIKVFEGLPQFKHNCPLFYWVKRVIINAALGQLRKNKSRVDREEPLDEHSSEVRMEAARAHETDELLWIIQKLAIEYRTVFNLYTIEGYSHKEIADMLNITESNSKVRLMRARQVLQEQLKKRMTA